SKEVEFQTIDTSELNANIELLGEKTYLDMVTVDEFMKLDEDAQRESELITEEQIIDSINDIYEELETADKDFD
ncbi:MAG: hypothetical protein MHPSP_003435, partial [Paramarteilia canceri]